MELACFIKHTMITAVGSASQYRGGYTLKVEFDLGINPVITDPRPEFKKEYIEVDQTSLNRIKFTLEVEV